MKTRSKRNEKKTARRDLRLKFVGAGLAAALVAAGVVCAVPQEAHAGTFAGYVPPSSESYNSEGNWPNPNFKRVQGNTALGTMRQVALEGWKDTGSEWAVVCRLDGWQDALSASGVAGLLDAPVLTTKTTELSDATKKALKELKVKKVVVAGGEQAISKATEKQIAALGIDVERVAGNTASGTAVQMYRFGLTHGGWSDTCAVATANTFQDALSIAPYAYSKHVPVLIAQDGKRNTGRTLTKTAQAVTKNFSRTLVLGGVAAVAESVDKTVPGAKRLKGRTAYGTSAAVATFCLGEGMSASHAGVATGKSYYDALSGAALCGKKGSVLVLADANKTNAVEKALVPHKGELSKTWENCGYIFGGKQAFDSKALNPLVKWGEKVPNTEHGVRWMEKCHCCQVVYYDPDDLSKHIDEVVDQQRDLLYSGKLYRLISGRIEDGWHEFDNGTGVLVENGYYVFDDGTRVEAGTSWYCGNYEYAGGTNVNFMKNGECYDSVWQGDGYLVREL